MAVSIKIKEILVQKSVFLKLPTNFIEPPVISSGLAHTKITEEVVLLILITQVANKASSLNKINFQVLQII